MRVFYYYWVLILWFTLSTDTHIHNDVLHTHQHIHISTYISAHTYQHIHINTYICRLFFGVFQNWPGWSSHFSTNFSAFFIKISRYYVHSRFTSHFMRFLTIFCVFFVAFRCQNWQKCDFLTKSNLEDIAIEQKMKKHLLWYIDVDNSMHTCLTTHQNAHYVQCHFVRVLFSKGVTFEAKRMFSIWEQLRSNGVTFECGHFRENTVQQKS